MYYIELSGIVAKELGKAFITTVTDGTNTYSVEYSALSYARTTVRQNYDMANMSRALYKYYLAAKAYFA